MKLDEVHAMFAPEGSLEMERLDARVAEEAFMKEVFPTSSAFAAAMATAEARASEMINSTPGSWREWPASAPRSRWLVWTACELVLANENLDWTFRALEIDEAEDDRDGNVIFTRIEWRKNALMPRD